MSDKFPGWRYGPKGEAAVFESENDVPTGWQDHPSKHAKAAPAAPAAKTPPAAKTAAPKAPKPAAKKAGRKPKAAAQPLDL